MNATQTITRENHEVESEHYEGGPRLEPIERPDSWWMWLVYKVAEWMQGTVITPLKVVQARFPESVRHAHEMQKLEDSLSISDELRTLLKRYVAALNGCTFCVDFAEAEAESHGLDVEVLRRLSTGENVDSLSPAQRAALEYARVATEHVHVPDEVFDELKAHYSEREIVEITWLCATENYYNLISAPLGIGSDGLCSV